MARLTTVLRTWPGRGLLVCIALVTAALAVPVLFGWHVHANAFAPLTAHWRPRFGPGTLPAAAIGVAVWRYGADLACRLPWSRLLATAFAVGLAWLISLAAVDGRSGLGAILQDPDEYLRVARRVTDVPALLQHFATRIPATAAHPWPTHIAGHPPGALLVFVLLARIGLGGALAAGLTVCVIAATTPPAVLATLRRLGADRSARRVAPLLVVGPAAIWSAVSADAIFTAVAAWGLFALAAASTARRPAGWALLSGVLLASCAYLSYGLVLIGVLALGVLVVARRWHALPGAAVGGAAVVAVFTASGFRWWDAVPLLHARYYAGIARVRPAGYWLWGDLAALTLCAGLALGPSAGAALRAAVVRGVAARPVAVLTTSALAGIVLADVSLLSKAEVERIWLPFVPWLLLGAALLPPRTRHILLGAQVGLALVLQTVLVTRW